MPLESRKKSLLVPASLGGALLIILVTVIFVVYSNNKEDIKRKKKGGSRESRLPSDHPEQKSGEKCATMLAEFYDLLLQPESSPEDIKELRERGLRECEDEFGPLIKVIDTFRKASINNGNQSKSNIRKKRTKTFVL